MYPVDGIQCPGCGGEVVYELTCHTYSRTRDDGTIQWMSCLPCDSATRYECSNRWEDDVFDPETDEYIKVGCDWNWTYGLNSGNPRAEENERNRMGFNLE